MNQKTYSEQELQEIFSQLPFHAMKKLVDGYSKESGFSFDNEVKQAITNSLQSQLEKHDINSVCPNCQSKDVVKNGKRSDGSQRYLCKVCQKRFTRFTGTILEKNNWHWDAWVKMLQMTINNLSLKSMQNVLERDYGYEGINIKTVWFWRMKLIHALSKMNTPLLSGVVQVDETFIRESQKGSRGLVSYLSKDTKRKPRYGRKPSIMGVMGPEFATVVTAIDNRGYCVCKVTAMGRVTKELITDFFVEHLDHPAYVCSDANTVYKEVCGIFNYPHYVRPSNYDEILKSNGVVDADLADVFGVKEARRENAVIMNRLYRREEIDHINNVGGLLYEDFLKLRKEKGLNLARVNELHKDIKLYIVKNMTNVSTKYLEYYVGFFNYIRNWRVTHGKYPSSEKDAEMIFVEILKGKANYTLPEAMQQEINLPMPSSRYTTLLRENTKRAREATNNKYFKFNEEDGVRSFDRRKYLFDLPNSKLYEISKECGIRGYRKMNKWVLISMILKHPDIENILYRSISENQPMKISEEDLEAIRASRFM